jgi:predicted transposase/invertase (TIGR01784 family)
MIAERSPEVKKAVVRLIELSADEKARALYEAREKERRDNRARERGAVLNVAKNLLEMDMPIEKIAKATGLSREEVSGLRQ